MAAYIDCQNAWVSILRGLTSQFSTTAQVAVNDYTVLDAGVLTAAVFTPGTVGRVPQKANYVRSWGGILDLFYAWRGDLPSSLTPFETLRAAVILAIDNNPNLVIPPATSGVAGVYDTTIESDGDPQPYPVTPGSATRFVAQRFRIISYQFLRAQ